MIKQKKTVIFTGDQLEKFISADTTDDEISIEEAKKITKSWILDLSKESMIVNINIETK